MIFTIGRSHNEISHSKKKCFHIPKKSKLGDPCEAVISDMQKNVYFRSIVMSAECVEW